MQNSVQMIPTDAALTDFSLGKEQTVRAEQPVVEHKLYDGQTSIRQAVINRRRKQWENILHQGHGRTFLTCECLDISATPTRIYDLEGKQKFVCHGKLIDFQVASAVYGHVMAGFLQEPDRGIEGNVFSRALSILVVAKQNFQDLLHDGFESESASDPSGHQPGICS
jgi:hypothetical protein